MLRYLYMILSWLRICCYWWLIVFDQLPNVLCTCVLNSLILSDEYLVLEVWLLNSWKMTQAAKLWSVVKVQWEINTRCVVSCILSASFTIIHSVSTESSESFLSQYSAWNRQSMTLQLMLLTISDLCHNTTFAMLWVLCIWPPNRGDARVLYQHVVCAAV